ncbi:hypothetical protein OAL04_01880 [Nitrospinae bacterium]|nr:hypothetical protein [Nitrospinota bacterium]
MANLIIFFLFFAILEGVASFYYAYQEVRQKIKKEPFLAERLHTEYDPLLGWINKPNISIDNMYGPNVYLKTNGQRFRGETDFTTNVPNGRIRVICSGDSFTLGYGVDNASTWCNYLELIDPRIQSVNMGQGGYGVGQAYLWYKRDGAQLDHSIHIFAFISEDFKRMMKKSFLGVPKPLLRVRNEEIIVENTPISRLSFRKIHEKYLKFFNIARLAKKVRGISFSENVNKPSVLIEKEMEELIGKVFGNLKKINRAKNSKLILVHLPTQYEHRSAYYENIYKFVRQEAEKKGITYLNLVREIRQVSSSEMVKFFFQKDIKDFAYSKGHLTPIGNLYVAKKISKTLTKSN